MMAVLIGKQINIYIYIFTLLKKIGTKKNALIFILFILLLIIIYRGKNGVHYFTHELLSKRYPASSFTEFKKMMDKYDPKRIFSNRFGDRIFGINSTSVNDIPNDVDHCAIQSYCLCKKSSDCSLTDTCSNIMGYPVCKPGIISLRKN